MAENIFNRIMAKYSIFTKSELKVADFILAHRSEVQYMTISELGKACSVAEATLTRFGKSLSCKGFNDLKLAIAQATVPESVESAYLCYGDVLPEDSIEQKCQKLLGRSMETLRQTIDLLDVKEVQKAVDYLQKASSVYCFGQGNSSIISMEAWGRFAIVTPKFHWVSDSHM